MRHAMAFRIYARLRGDERHIRSGRYELTPGAGWNEILDALTEGRVVTVPMTVPEGFRLAQMVPRIARAAGGPGRVRAGDAGRGGRRRTLRRAGARPRGVPLPGHVPVRRRRARGRRPQGHDPPVPRGVDARAARPPGLPGNERSGRW
ncbi:MAG: endolytic transglycosylase MltG [Desulfomicrobium escambiense]|nr:endolytic transglycosylase MltG [Desulfomicrobium escambiense]